MFSFSEFEEVVFKLQELIENSNARLVVGKSGCTLQVQDENKNFFENNKRSNILQEILGYIIPNLLRKGIINENFKEKAELVKTTILNDDRTKKYMFRILASDNIIDSFEFQTIIKPHLDNKYCSGILMINYTDLSDEDKSIKFEVNVGQIENIIKFLTEAKEELTKYQEQL